MHLDIKSSMNMPAPTMVSSLSLPVLLRCKVLLAIFCNVGEFEKCALEIMRPSGDDEEEKDDLRACWGSGVSDVGELGVAKTVKSSKRINKSNNDTYWIY